MSESTCTAPASELLGAHPAQAPGGARIDAIDVGRRVSGRQLLQDMSLSVEPGELVAIAGGSGAGKTTLLEVLAGLQPPSAGEVRHDGVIPRIRAGETVGYVPQDDIIHLEMPLRRTLRYAALLRLPAGTSATAAERIVDETLQSLDLADRADVPVRALSGGQRKRASIAVELLTRPRLFFLDEPTSGLDPSTAADVMRLLRRLSRQGVTVVLTTHEPAGIDQCDRVVFLARDGHLAFAGTPDAARRYFGVESLTQVYQRLAGEHTPRIWANRFAESREKPPTRPGFTRKAVSPTPSDANRTGPVRQWWLLTRRNVDVLFRNRLTLAILLGSPVLVTAMMATLFKPGAFDPGATPGVGPAQIVFWIAFDGFFFGLTYGLLQIVGEMAVFRRERLAGLSVGAYVASKVTALLPVLAAVSAVLLVVLRALGRLPALGWHVYALLFVTIVIEAISALALGLLASAAVSNAAQAALALPMLCFPQVLFGGAIVPVDQMAMPGRLMSLVLSNRHAFDALGRDLQLGRYTSTLPAMSVYRHTFEGGNAVSLIALASFAVALTLATAWLLDRRSRPGASMR
jgi:ABC-type multidrug transport system ATPase subunit